MIVGGVAAGMKAAAVCRRRSPDANITVFQDEDDISYSACGMPYHLEDSEEIPREKLVARTAEKFRADGVDVRTGCRVEAVDTAAKRLTVRNLSDDTVSTSSYDRLLIATGARAIQARLEIGDRAPQMLQLRSLGDADRIRAALPEVGAAVVVGGGYIGLEMAEALRHRGTAVTLVEMAPRLLPAFDEDIAARLLQELERNGVTARCGRKVIAARDGQVELDSGDSIACDLVLLCTGVRPNVGLAEAMGLELGPTGAIKVDARMATSVPDVYAAGDCCEATHVVSNTPVWYPLGDIASRQGRVAGTNLAGGEEAFTGVLGTAIFRAFEHVVARTGLSKQQAEDAGFDPVDIAYSAPSRAKYMPASRNLTVSLVVDRATTRLLGAQVDGADGVDKCVDILATAIWAKLPVDALRDLDLAYAPPFSPLLAPVQIGGELGKRAVSA
uniref:Putative pyridine nucleotide-disulphide oxidoreductase n=1 Tax=Haliea sp. ETY-M TaxID=1055105 RepID=A0A455R1V0_9GAMM|nr:putative pyridine nucleotide-disulphide oxidoreductase [Haliea sp. ETY-M]